LACTYAADDVGDVVADGVIMMYPPSLALGVLK
jgi:hypothetical protein